MSTLIIPWGEVLPGDQALDDGKMITVTGIRVYDMYPGFPVAAVSGTLENGRPVALSLSARSLTAVHRPAAPCEADDCDNPAAPCECGAAHCPDHPHEREWRVHGNPDGDRRHAVSELTCDHGLVPVITGLDRWQALAIVAILAHPHGD